MCEGSFACVCKSGQPEFDSRRDRLAMVIRKLALESWTVQRNDAASAPCSSLASRLADAPMNEAVAIVGCGLVGSG